MAYYSGKDVTAFTFNSADMKADVMSVDGISRDLIMTQWRGLGSAAKSSKSAGQYEEGEITAKFILTDSASGAAQKCALGTSATLTIGLATGMSISGTAVVRSVTLEIPEDGHDTLSVTFVPDGGMTWDLTP